jgi:WD40 repeat protein
MAPEQAVGGASVGPAADIFALGAILYELITGRPPFKGPSVVETLELVRHAEPTPPAQLQPGCPRDLETICLKCLHKEPARRYAGAVQLAEDLRRFLSNEPIQARPVGRVERLGKWLRRRPALAASIGLGTLAALAVVTLTVRLLYSWELEDANQKLVEAVGAKEDALVAADDARRAAEFNHQQADEARSKLDAALGRERALHYLHSFSLAHRELQGGRVEQGRRLLDACPEDLRHWEWHYLYRQCHAELLTLHGTTRGSPALAVSPSGGLIAAASVTRSYTPVESKLLIWDAASGKVNLELLGLPNGISRLAFSPDGARFAYASGELNAWAIHICDVQTGRELCKIPGTTFIGRLAFSPDGSWLAASAGAQILFYDPADGAELFTLPAHTASVSSFAFSADGQRLVTGGTDRLVSRGTEKLVKLWDLTTRKEVFSARGHLGAIADVAFSPKGDQIVSCGGLGLVGTVRGEVRVWNAADGKPAPVAMTFPFPVVAAAFTANPGQIACAGGDGVHFLDVRTGKTVFTLRGHTGEVTRMVATADGTRLVTSGADLTVRVWPVRNPEFMQIPLERPNVSALAFSPDGARLALSDYGTGPGVRVLPVPPHAEGPRDIRLRKGALPIHALAFFQDNHRLAGADRDGVHLWDLDDEAASRYIADFGVWEVSISPDGRHLATATRHPDVNPRPDLVPEVPVPKAKGGLPILPRPPVPAIKIWRVADGQLERTLPGQISVSFSPDGRRLAGARDKNVVVWNAATGEELRTLSGLNEPVLRVRFADGGRQVVGFSHHQAAVWDAETGRTIATTDGLSGPAFVTPDGRRFVRIQGGIKWWDARLGREILVLPVPGGSGPLSPLALSADGRCVATSSGNKLMLWEAGP